MKPLTADEAQPSLNELSQALHTAGSELLNFACIHHRDELQAERIVLDVLLLALENHWFHYSLETEEFGFKEFREEVYALLWEKIQESKVGMQESRSSNESEMRFFRLNLMERAVIYLRMSAKFSVDSIARIMKIEDKAEVEIMLERCREVLLGHKIRVEEI